MSAIIILGLVAFFLCLLLTPMVRDEFIRRKLVDEPDGGRKFHLTPTPRVGGIAIVLSYVGSLGVVYLVAPHGVRLYVQHSRLLWSLLPATGLMFLTGLLDDLKNLRPWQKLVGQSLAAGLAVGLGAHMTMAHGPVWVSSVISFVWLIACANALNLIDGMDGLASGVALFATLATIVMALMSGNMGLAVATVPLAACLVAFLRYNFAPATIFLGDCGSLTIGFMLGCFGLIWSQRTGSFHGLAAPLMALALPLIDVGLAIGRRLLRSVPIFEGDRSHIHHRMLARGLTTRGAVLALYGVCGTASMLALLLSFSAHQFKWVIAFVFCILAVVGINKLRYVELSALVRSLSRRSMLRLVQEEIYLHELEQALAETDTMETFWTIACTACEDLRFATLQMKLRGKQYSQVIVAGETNSSWRLTVPLGGSGEMTLTRGAEAGFPPRLTMAVLERLQDAVQDKERLRNSLRDAAPSFSYRGAA